MQESLNPGSSLFFLVFVNDIVCDIDSKIYICADDTSLVKPIVNPVESHKNTPMTWKVVCLGQTVACFLQIIFNSLYDS